MMMESPVGTTYELLRSHSTSCVNTRVTDKADSFGELSTALITGKGSCICGLGCRDGLACRSFPSAALLYCSSNATSLKCCTPVRQAFCHLDLLPARSFQVAGSMPVHNRLALKFSLKRSNGRQLGLVTDGSSAKKVAFGVLPSDILRTWPTQRSCALMMNASIPNISHLCSISVLGILSCHVILAMRRRKRMCSWSRLRIWRR